MGDPWVVESLRAAARGAPELRRALDEPPLRRVRPPVLLEFGVAEMHAGLPAKPVLLSTYLGTGVRFVFADGAFAGRLLDWAHTFLRTTLHVVRKPAGQRGFAVADRLSGHLSGRLQQVEDDPINVEAVELGDALVDPFSQQGVRQQSCGSVIPSVQA